jgi:hypothetical protein
MNWLVCSVERISENLRHFMTPWTSERLTAWPQTDVPQRGYATMPRACFKPMIPVCIFTRQTMP